MDDRRIGRAILVLRQRRGWRQQDLAARAGVSSSAISDMEHGHVDRYTLTTIRRVLHGLDASGELDVMWGGRGGLDHLLDADHARLMQAWADRHRQAGWEIWSEASYSIYGERGRIDMLAFDGATGVLEVTEGKTGIWDVQDTIGRLDAKIRLAREWSHSADGWCVGSSAPWSWRKVARHAGASPSMRPCSSGSRLAGGPRMPLSASLRGLHPGCLCSFRCHLPHRTGLGEQDSAESGFGQRI